MKSPGRYIISRSESQIAGNEFVPRAVHGKKITRICRIGLQLLPQAEHVVIHGSRGGIILVAPHFIQQFFAGNNSRRRIGEIFQ